MTGTLHEDRYKFFIISRTLLLRMRNVSDKICIEKQNTHFMFSNFFFFFFENRTAYEIMWKRFIASARLQMLIWRMRIACLIPLVTNTLSEYASQYNNGCTSSPECYIISTLIVMCYC
jgi:hypothetical protein